MGGGDTLMFIFSRRSKVILECFTHRDYVHIFNPIQPTSNFVPEWFSKLPATTNADNFVPRSTIKKCPAVTNLILEGFMMPLWTDLALKIHNSKQDGSYYEFQFADRFTSASDHNPEQWGEMWDNDIYRHMKITSVWRMKTKDEINFLWHHPYYHKIHECVQIIPAIEEYKYQNSTNINLMIDMTKASNLLLRHSSPLVQLIPLTEKKVEVKNHLVSENEWKNIQATKFFAFQNNYKATKKCPFHKG